MTVYLLVCADVTHRAAALDATSVALVPAHLPAGACGLRRVVPLADTDDVPAEVARCASCVTASHAEWTAYQSGPAWVRHEPQEWTGTEKAVLVPVAEGTRDHVAHLAAGWAACEYHDGSRLVRYTGDVPDALAAYHQLTAEEVTALAATEVR